MNKADILKLATEAGADTYTPVGIVSDKKYYAFELPHLTLFAELVAKQERDLYMAAIERLRKVPFIEVPTSADTEVNEIVTMFDAVIERLNNLAVK